MADPTQTPDLSEKAVEAANDFFAQLYSFFELVITRFCTNGYKSIADMSGKRWTKVIGSVIFYILVRPYIEKGFKWLHDRDRRLEKEKKEKERAEFGKAKVSANSLRGGKGASTVSASGSSWAAAAAADGKGRVLGEVEGSDDEVELEDEEDMLPHASGVGSEWNKMARRRQKNYIKNVRKDQRAEDLSRDQIMELLDWSDEEGAKKDA